MLNQSTLQQQIKAALDVYLNTTLEPALEKGFAATFYMGNSDIGRKISKNFAQKTVKEAANGTDDLANLIATAVYSFVTSADVTGVPAGLTSPMGPVTGALVPGTVKII